jgi:Fe-S cluster assembly iron-binding protein IscA
MLTFTESAATTIRDITSRPGMPDTNGLRISSNTANPERPSLAVALAQAPAPEDQVIELPDARVFLEPEAADMLQDKVLDAQVAEDGSVAFRVSLQAPS